MDHHQRGSQAHGATEARNSPRPHPPQPSAGLAAQDSEFGDDPGRYLDAKARKTHAGTAPITRASGTKNVVMARYGPHQTTR